MEDSNQFRALHNGLFCQRGRGNLVTRRFNLPLLQLTQNQSQKILYGINKHVHRHKQYT